MDAISTLSLSEDLINRDLRERIIVSVGSYVSDYYVSFSGGRIFLDLNLHVKALGNLSAKYMLEVLDFRFDKESHFIKLSYQEDIKSRGGPMQGIMLKAAGFTGGTFLQKALSITKLPGVWADEKSCSINLEQLFDLKKGILSDLEAHYLDSRNGLLQFSFFFSILPFSQ